MSVFGIILLVLFSIVCLLLIFMVVIQDQDSDGLGGLFSGAGNAAFGSRSSNVIVRFTYILGALFFVIAFGLAMISRSSVGDVEAAVRAQGGQTSEWWSQQPAGTTPPAPTAPEAPATPTAPSTN
jgi:preprotein translocase subunit SecG